MEYYTAQGYIDRDIVDEKKANKDYAVTLGAFCDDGNEVLMVIDGNHSLIAALEDGVEPEITIDRTSDYVTAYKTLEDYVIAFGDLDNPVNPITGKYLW